MWQCLKTAVFNLFESKVEEIVNVLNSNNGAWFIQSLVKIVRKWMDKVRSESCLLLFLSRRCLENRDLKAKNANDLTRLIGGQVSSSKLTSLSFLIEKHMEYTQFCRELIRLTQEIDAKMIVEEIVNILENNVGV